MPTAYPFRDVLNAPFGEAMTDAQKRRKIQAMYRRWLKDEAFISEIMPRPSPEYSDCEEILRNLGSAIAYAQALAKAPSLS